MAQDDTMRVKTLNKSPLTDLVEFAKSRGITAVFREVQDGTTIYYLVKPGYYSNDKFEDRLEMLQHHLFPENNTLILCASKSREDSIWAKSVRVYWRNGQN